MIDDGYAKFLELSEDELYEFLTGVKLHWWQKLEFKLIIKWWSRWRKMHPDLRAFDLWESIYKGRF